MELTTIISVVTFIVTLILGELGKKFNLIKKNMIPIQNICVGIIIACIEFIFTKDFKMAIMLSGLVAGGTYDIIHNLNKILNRESE